MKTIYDFLKEVDLGLDENIEELKMAIMGKNETQKFIVKLRDGNDMFITGGGFTVEDDLLKITQGENEVFTIPLGSISFVANTKNLEK